MSKSRIHASLMLHLALAACAGCAPETELRPAPERTAPLAPARAPAPASQPNRADAAAPPTPSGRDAGPERSAEPAAESGRCTTPPGVTRAPETIREVMALMNALPRPTSLACFVESLPRPLEVYLTSSTLSAQPAAGEDSPRIFVIHEPLFLAFVPEGLAEGLLEIGWRTSPERAIRTEVVFPLAGPVRARDLVDHIALTDRNSFCGNCHFGESAAYDEFLGDQALESNVNHPRPAAEVDLEWLRSRAEQCDPSASSERCTLLRALFDHGEVRRSRAFAEPG